MMLQEGAAALFSSTQLVLFALHLTPFFPIFCNIFPFFTLLDNKAYF